MSTMSPRNRHIEDALLQVVRGGDVARTDWGASPASPSNRHTEDALLQAAMCDER